MESFNYSIPTKLFYGDESGAGFADVIAESGCKKVLLHYGGGSVMKNGAYDTTMSLLKERNIEVVEAAGQVPNPRHQICIKAARQYIAEGCDAIVGLGGGSVCDASKYVACCVHFLLQNPGCDDDLCWDIVMEKTTCPGKEGLPKVFCVCCLSGTASEANGGFVITNLEGEIPKKLYSAFPIVAPVSSWIAPMFQDTVPDWHLCATGCDIMSHCFESYESMGQHTGRVPTAAAGMVEAVIESVRENVPILLKDPKDRLARMEMCWSGTLSLVGILHVGNPSSFACHCIEHAVSAVFPDCTHGATLALLHVGLWRFYEENYSNLTKGQQLMFDRLKEKVFKGAKNAEEIVAQWRDMLKSWNMPSTLSEMMKLQKTYGEKTYDQWIDDIVEAVMYRQFSKMYDFQAEDIKKILLKSD